MIQERRLPPRGAPPQLDPEARTLLDDIIRRPDDDGPRLVYADWLLKREDPRGEFIVAQCELARLQQQKAADKDRIARLQARADALLKKHKQQWTAPLKAGSLELTIGENRYVRGNPTHWTFVRGFVDEVTMNDGDLCVAAATLLAYEPVRRINVTGMHRRDGYFFEVEQASHLRELGLARNRLYPEIAEALARTPFDALQVLDLTDCGIGPKAMRKLAEATRDRWPSLAAIDLAGNNLKDSGTKVLASWELLHGRRFERINLSVNDISEKGVTALAAAPLSVRELRLACNVFGPAGATALARASWLATVETLDIRNCGLDQETLRSMRSIV